MCDTGNTIWLIWHMVLFVNRAASFEIDVEYWRIRYFTPPIIWIVHNCIILYLHNTNELFEMSSIYYLTIESPCADDLQNRGGFGQHHERIQIHFNTFLDSSCPRVLYLTVFKTKWHWMRGGWFLGYELRFCLPIANSYNYIL